jgi:DNA polymerase I
MPNFQEFAPVDNEGAFSHSSHDVGNSNHLLSPHPKPGPLSPSAHQGSGPMQNELRKGLALQPGTFSAVIAPEKMMIAAINSNADLQRFLFLYISGNYSRILAGLNRSSKNFEVRRSFTAHQLLSTLRESGHTVIFVEHDPSLFDNAMDTIEPIAGALKEAGRRSPLHSSGHVSSSSRSLSSYAAALEIAL